MNDKQRKCNCSKRRAKLANKKKERCTRLRATLVYNPEKEYYCEPYMDLLRQEYSPAQSECPSGIELPWTDIAIDESDLQKFRVDEPKEKKRTIKSRENLLIKKVSSGKMCIPWEQLTVTDTIQSAKAKLKVDQCDLSSVEIPWEDIMFDPKIEITLSDKDLRACRKDEVEIPWNDLLVPRNITFYPKIKRLPSSKSKSKTKDKKCACSNCSGHDNI